jgi:hypothetical protein
LYFSAVAHFADKAFRELKKDTNVNCWHQTANESDAMWSLYADEHKGVVICSTLSRMGSALKPFFFTPQAREPEELWVGPVRYTDLTQGRVIANWNEPNHRVWNWKYPGSFDVRKILKRLPKDAVREPAFASCSQTILVPGGLAFRSAPSINALVIINALIIRPSRDGASSIRRLVTSNNCCKKLAAGRVVEKRAFSRFHAVTKIYSAVAFGASAFRNINR